MNPRIADALAVARADRDALKRPRKTEQDDISSAGAQPSRKWLKARCRVAARPGAASMREADEASWKLWAGKAVALLKEAAVPAMAAAGRMEDPHAAELAVLGSVRAGTLQSRVRPWASLVKWLRWRRGRSWPAGPADIFDFLHERQRVSPVGSFPLGLRASLNWFEARSGLPEEEKLGNQDLVCRMLEKAVAEGVDQLGEIKRAPRMPIVLVVELEALVGSSTEATGIDKTRAVVAWSRLLKLYGAMRADDLQRVRPDSVTLGEAGLVLKLLRTKVSGPGKRVRELVVFVPTGLGSTTPRG